MVHGILLLCRGLRHGTARHYCSILLVQGGTGTGHEYRGTGTGAGNGTDAGGTGDAPRDTANEGVIETHTTMLRGLHMLHAVLSVMKRAGQRPVSAALLIG